MCKACCFNNNKSTKFASSIYICIGKHLNHCCTFWFAEFSEGGKRDGRVWDGEDGIEHAGDVIGLAGLHTSDNISTINPRPAGGRQHNRLNQNQATDLELHVSCFWALPEEYMLMMQDSVSPCRHRSQWRHANMPKRSKHSRAHCETARANRPWSLVMTG